MLYLVARGMIVVLTAVGDVEVAVCLSTPPASRRRAILGSTCLAPPRRLHSPHAHVVLWLRKRRSCA
jgi:hypothetical protein